MLFGNRRLYEQTRTAKLGKMNLAQPLAELRCWVSEKYAVNVLNVVCDRIDIGPHEGRPRLNLILDTADHYAKLHKDRLTPKPNVKKAILCRFSAIVAAANLDDEYDTTDVHLTFDDFSDEAMGQAATRFLETDKQRVIDEFARFHVWDISGFSKSLVVFYLNDKDVPKNEQNGCSESITQRCYELVRQYDEFDFYHQETFSIAFDSKENLNKHYGGSLFNYFR